MIGDANIWQIALIIFNGLVDVRSYVGRVVSGFMI